MWKKAEQDEKFLNVLPFHHWRGLHVNKTILFSIFFIDNDRQMMIVHWWSAKNKKGRKKIKNQGIGAWVVLKNSWIYKLINLIY